MISNQVGLPKAFRLTSRFSGGQHLSSHGPSGRRAPRGQWRPLWPQRPADALGRRAGARMDHGAALAPRRSAAGEKGRGFCIKNGKGLGLLMFLREFS